MPPKLITSLQLLPYVVVSGAHRTFLKEGTTHQYIPGGRVDRKKGAPYTVFVRALHLKKNCLPYEDHEHLDQGEVSQLLKLRSHECIAITI